jgi:hypothetical protein
MKRLLAVAGTLALAAGAFATYTITSAGADGPAMNRFTYTFAGDCVYKQVDPIDAPGQPVSAHNHCENGNTDFSSTSGSGTNEWPVVPGHEADRGYTVKTTNGRTYGSWSRGWVPVAFLNGVQIHQGTFQIVYQSPAGSKTSAIRFASTMIAGDSHANGTVVDPHVQWTCGNIDVTWPSPHDCANIPGGVVTAQLIFPDCWDGSTALDTPAGIGVGHFSYSANGVCPPVPGTPNPDGNDQYRGLGPRIAQLVFQQTFLRPDGQPLTNPINPEGNVALSFSSGPWYTYHGDWIENDNHDTGDFGNVCLNQILHQASLQVSGLGSNNQCVTGQTKVNNILLQ